MDSSLCIVSTGSKSGTDMDIGIARGMSGVEFFGPKSEAGNRRSFQGSSKDGKKEKALIVCL